MKKIYISLPMAGMENTVHSRFEYAVNKIKQDERFKDYEIVGPVNIKEFYADNVEVTRVYDYAWYMGEDIRELLRCDAILMSPGWWDSNGCKCEKATADIYNKEIFYISSVDDSICQVLKFN